MGTSPKMAQVGDELFEGIKIIPVGYCQCGCGQRTNICTKSDPRRNRIKGKPYRYCAGHNQRGKSPINKGKKFPEYSKENHPLYKNGKTTNTLGYALLLLPENPRANSKGYVSEHIFVAEKTLGETLPVHAIIHHVNGDRADNTPGNLVICQDQAYHMLLHKRERALHECGHAGWIKCIYCHKYDDPSNMWVPKHKRQGARHRECQSAYKRNRYQANKAHKSDPQPQIPTVPQIHPVESIQKHID